MHRNVVKVRSGRNKQRLEVSVLAMENIEIVVFFLIHTILRRSIKKKSFTIMQTHNDILEKKRFFSILFFFFLHFFSHLKILAKLIAPIVFFPSLFISPPFFRFFRKMNTFPLQYFFYSHFFYNLHPIN